MRGTLHVARVGVARGGVVAGHCQNFITKQNCMKTSSLCMCE